MSENRKVRERRRRFLQALRQGSAVLEAVEFAHVARSTVYEWRASNAAFAAEWDAAQTESAGALRRRAHELAMTGSVRMLIYLLERADRRESAAAADEPVGTIEIIGVDGEAADPDATFLEFVA